MDTVHVNGADLWYLVDPETGQILGWKNAANQDQLLAATVTNGTIDGGSPGSSYGSSDPIDGGGV